MAIQVIHVEKDIDVAIQHVWSLITAWGSEKLWFPNMVAVTSDGFGVGATRRMTFSPGDFTVTERLEVVDKETHTMVYVLTENPNHAKATHPRGTISLHRLGNATTRFSWKCSVEFLEPSFKDEYEKFLDDTFRGAIDVVAAKLAV